MNSCSIKELRNVTLEELQANHVNAVSLIPMLLTMLPFDTITSDNGGEKEQKAL
jgi:hypothetical protein